MHASSSADVQMSVGIKGVVPGEATEAHIKRQLLLCKIWVRGAPCPAMRPVCGCPGLFRAAQHNTCPLPCSCVLYTRSVLQQASGGFLSAVAAW